MGTYLGEFVVGVAVVLAAAVGLHRVRRNAEERREAVAHRRTARLVAEEALAGVARWPSARVRHLVMGRSLPQRMVLTPDRADLATRYAGPGAAALATGLRWLRECEEQFEIARQMNGKTPQQRERDCDRLCTLLKVAEGELRTALRELGGEPAELPTDPKE